MLARFAVRHPVTVGVACAALALFGVLSARTLAIDLLPELSAPRIAVLLRSGDRPPDELETRYARPLENALSTLSGVASVRTKSTVGRVLATVEYEWDTNMDFALLDVQKQVAPFATDRDVDSLVARRFDPAADPIVVVALAEKPGADRGVVGAEEGALDRLRVLALERVARTLERLPGVASVQVAGGRRREVRVTVDPVRLQAYGLSVDSLANVLRAGNAEASGGTVEERGRVHVIKGIGKFERLEDVTSLPIPGLTQPVAGSNSGGAPLTVGDVADVRWADAPVRGLVAVGDAASGLEGTAATRGDLGVREGVSLAVYKEPGRNTVAVSDAVRHGLESLDHDLGGLQVTVVRDQAAYIRSAIHEVEEAALVGSLLAILVLALFLRSARAIMLLATAIPLSLAGAFALMAMTHMSFNLMTLGGLALGCGRLVDDAIVVLEAIFRRLEEGEAPADAAVAGAREVGGAITASTLTTIVVFVPVIFLKGLAAELFRGLALAVSYSLLGSLAVALIVIPCAAARLFTAESALRARAFRSGAAWARYESALRAALRRPALVVGCVCLLLVVAGAVGTRLPREFLPPSDAGEVTAKLVMPEGTSVAVTAEAARRMDAAVRQALPGTVEASVAEIGESVRDDSTLSEDVPAENRGVLRLKLAPARSGRPGSPVVQGVLAAAAKQVSGLSLELPPSDAVLGRLADQGPPVRVEVLGADEDALEHATSAVRTALAASPQLVGVASSLDDRRAEVRLVLDRVVAAGLQLSPDALARQLRQRLGDEAATTFRLEGQDRDVVLRAPPQTLESLGTLALDAPGGQRVRVGDVAALRVESAPTAIERTLGTRFAVVTAGVARGVALGQAAQAVEATLRKVQLPSGVRVQVGGAERERRESFRQLLLAAGLAILLVTMVMASLFESLLHPFTILFTLPTAAVGVVGALAASGNGWSVASLLGAVMLAGIAVSNGILLVDVARHLREAGIPAQEALVTAGRLRVRPILMTSLTAILGVLPLAVSRGEGAGIRAPMALALAGGLLTSTALTLFLVPVVHDLLDRLRPGGAR